MKKLLIILCVLLIGVPVSFASGDDYEMVGTRKTVITEPIEIKKLEPVCPKTRMNESCLTCHQSPGFELKPIKELDPFESYDPPSLTEWRREFGKDVLIFDIKDAGIASGIADNLEKAFSYASRHKLKKLIIELRSPGGSLFHGWSIIGTIQMYKKQGFIVETRLKGISASAASLIFVSGSKGYRKVSPQAALMFHELTQFKFMTVNTPSDTEENARIMRYLQDTMSNYLADRSKLSKKEWDEHMNKKNHWVNGAEAIEIYGIADGYL